MKSTKQEFEEFNKACIEFLEVLGSKEVVSNGFYWSDDKWTRD